MSFMGLYYWQMAMKVTQQLWQGILFLGRIRIRWKLSSRRSGPLNAQLRRRLTKTARSVKALENGRPACLIQNQLHVVWSGKTMKSCVSEDERVRKCLNISNAANGMQMQKSYMNKTTAPRPSDALRSIPI